MTLRGKHSLGLDRTLNAVRDIGMLVTDNERYAIYDLDVNELTLSVTELKPRQETRGHSHEDASEIYFFISGSGRMQVGIEQYYVEKGSLLFVPGGEFHKVINLSKERLVFGAVFQGDRYSKRYKYKSSVRDTNSLQ